MDIEVVVPSDQEMTHSSKRPIHCKKIAAVKQDITSNITAVAETATDVEHRSHEPIIEVYIKEEPLHYAEASSSEQQQPLMNKNYAESKIESLLNDDDDDYCNQTMTNNPAVIVMSNYIKKPISGTSSRKGIHKCSECNYETARKCKLVCHLRRHTGDKPFECPVCKFKTHRKYHLVYHMQTHVGAKPFECSVCQYKAAKKSNMDRHMRMHTGDKPFGCSMCDFKTHRKDQLVYHIRMHTGDKPFGCSICDFKTHRKDHLVYHMRNHAGIKPFECSECNYKAMQKCDIKKHIERHAQRIHLARQEYHYEPSASISAAP